MRWRGSVLLPHDPRELLDSVSHSPGGDPPECFGDDVAAHLRFAFRALDERDRYLSDRSPGTIDAPRHVDLKAIPLGVDPPQVEAAEHLRGIYAKARRGVLHRQAHREPGVRRRRPAPPHPMVGP